MSLSKPLMDLLANYLQNLYLHPIRTKSLTSCVLASSANVSSQLISGERRINLHSILAFGGFGLFFGGPIPHFFFMALEKLIPARKIRSRIILQVLIERFLYTPLFQMFSLYTITRFEGKDHEQSLKFMQSLIRSVLLANWKFLTIFQVINLYFVPPMFRVLFVNLIGFFWVMYLAKVRRDKARRGAEKQQ